MGAFTNVKMKTVNMFKGPNHLRMKPEEHDIMRCAAMGEEILRFHKCVGGLMWGRQNKRGNFQNDSANKWGGNNLE